MFNNVLKCQRSKIVGKRYIYLSGKIIKGHEATNYRGLVAKGLRELGFESLDPLRGKYDSSNEWSKLSPNEIVARDLSDIDRSSVVLSVMMKSQDSSFGTPAEILYAWQKHIPIILVTNEQYLIEHPWVKVFCSHIFFVDEENGDQLFVTLLNAVQHIGKWYGEAVEQEVYTNPSLNKETQTQDMTPVPKFCTGSCRCSESCQGHKK